MQIKIEHIAKIEGHAGMIADIAQGQVEQVRIDVMEGARLLEGILRDRNIYEVSQITARVCGVCPVVHTFASLKALEKALEIEISPETLLLRKLMMMGQIINSHSLHLFFFSLADFFGIKSDLTLIKKYPDRAKDALVVREYGNQLVEYIGGRSIHPITPTIGGFHKLPDKEKLQKLLTQSSQALKSVKNLAELFARLKPPKFIRSAPFVGLTTPKEYAFYDGLVKTPSERKVLPADFMNEIDEFQIALNPVTKRSKHRGKTFMVGALARLNHNRQQLNPLAKKYLKAAGIHFPNFNPFNNILAQAVEMVHCVEESQKLLKEVLRKTLDKNDVRQQEKIVQGRLAKLKEGTAKGSAAVEAPRGTLYYFYEIGGDGRVKNCNIITPTSQNLARLEEDIAEFLPVLIGQTAISDEDRKDKIKMLVRAYDPCLTCATH